MHILRGFVDDQRILVLDCRNIGIEQFALFVQVLGLFLECGLNTTGRSDARG